MDFLTTNFIFDEITSYFYGRFRLLDLPLEILFKVLIFLDDPDLQNLAKTCRYLRIVANERFISRSKFLYVKQKIGISLSLRPTSEDLFRRNILPTSSKDILMNFNVNHFEVTNCLQKSFRKDKLSRRLNQRPTKEELKVRNIIPESETSDFVKKKLKELKKQNLSEMFDILVESYKYQNQNPKQIPKDYENLQEINKKILLGLGDVSDEFTQVYLKFFKRLQKNISISESLGNKKDINKSATVCKINEFLNHIENFSNQEQDLNNKENVLLKKNTSKVHDSSNVQSRRDFFESLSNPGSRCVSSSDSITEENSSNENNVNNEAKKRPKMILRASVNNDNLINYEKVY